MCAGEHGVTLTYQLQLTIQSPEVNQMVDRWDDE